MAHMKTCFRQLKYDLAWLVNHLLHTCYTSPDSGDTEPSSPSSHTLDLDSFLAAVTAILSEKSYVISFPILDSQKMSNMIKLHFHELLVTTSMCFFTNHKPYWDRGERGGGEGGRGGGRGGGWEEWEEWEEGRREEGRREEG